MNSMFLESERVILTEISVDDALLLFELDSDPDVMKHLTDGKPSTMQDIASAMERIRKVIEKFQYKFGFWLAYSKENHEFMGWFHFRPGKSTPDDVKNIELGYRLKKKFWGKGYATEVSTRLIDIGFEKYELDSVFATTMKANLASQKVMQKLGLKHASDYEEEGFPGEDKSAVKYVIKKNDWIARRNSFKVR